MAEVVIDFSNVQEFDPIEPGNYPVFIDQVEMRASKSSDYPYMNWTLTITEGEAVNRKLFFMTSLSPKALWRAKAVFESLGIFQEKMSIQTDEESNLVLEPELSGLVAMAVVTQEVYEGRIVNRVQDLIPMDSGVSVPPPSGTAPQMAAQPQRQLPNTGAKKFQIR